MTGGPSKCFYLPPMTELSPMEKLWAASAEVSGVEILTPAAQAVLKAYGSSPLLNDHVLDHRHCLAAALRAAIDQVVPEYRENRPKTFDEKHRKMDGSPIRYCLLDIADELEAQ
jgi:hypothetical protein